jgi:hypothetical protein
MRRQLFFGLTVLVLCSCGKRQASPEQFALPAEKQPVPPEPAAVDKEAENRFREWAAPLKGDVSPDTFYDGLAVLFLQPTVTDADLQKMPSCPSVRRFVMPVSKITGRGLKEIARLKGIKTLSLWFTPVDDDGLKELSELPELKQLFLKGTRVTGATLSALAGLPHLEELDLEGTKTTDEGLKDLPTLKALSHVALDNTAVTDAGLAHVIKHPKLRSISLKNTAITDEGLKQLSGMKTLHSVDVQQCPKVTEAAIKQLKRDHPDWLIWP